jgi:transposase InsO family protein
LSTQVTGFATRLPGRGFWPWYRISGCVSGRFDLEIMQRLDRLHLEYPFACSRMLRGLPASQRCKIGRRHVKTLMRRMGIEALYRRPRTTKPEPGHKIYRYLLRGMEITRPNQVWAMDITYIPMAHGFVYLAVVLDWATRRVLSWRLSITMEAAFLRRDVGGCSRSSRQAGNLQHRPGVAVHGHGVHRSACQPRHRHGWQRGLAGQSVR